MFKKKSRRRSSSSSSTDSFTKTEKYQLSDMRYIEVYNWRAYTYVSIREYYRNESGKMKPRRKGICLKVDEWHRLRMGFDWINEKIARVSKEDLNDSSSSNK